MQYSIIKDALRTQLKHLALLPETFETSSLSRTGRSIIFTSNKAGLAAAGELKQQNVSVLCPLYPAEMREFLQRHPDPLYKYHVHIWSHFIESLDDLQEARLTESYPLPAREKYWLHVEGLISGPPLARGAEHLWSWNGTRPRLLKKSLAFWAP